MEVAAIGAVAYILTDVVVKIKSAPSTRQQKRPVGQQLVVVDSKKVCPKGMQGCK